MFTLAYLISNSSDSSPIEHTEYILISNSSISKANGVYKLVHRVTNIDTSDDFSNCFIENEPIRYEKLDGSCYVNLQLYIPSYDQDPNYFEWIFMPFDDINRYLQSHRFPTTSRTDINRNCLCRSDIGWFSSNGSYEDILEESNLTIKHITESEAKSY